MICDSLTSFFLSDSILILRGPVFSMPPFLHDTLQSIFPLNYSTTSISVFVCLFLNTGMESSDQWPFLSELQWLRRRKKRAVSVSVALSLSGTNSVP